MAAEPTINNQQITTNGRANNQQLTTNHQQLLVRSPKLVVRSYKLLVASRQSFTLIEILVAVALIAVLSVAVIMSLNPQELIKQSRDSTRLSDLQNLNKSLSWFEADTGGTGFMGSSSVIYVSIPDTTSTCANLGLPTPPSGWSYHCVTQQNLQKTDGSGWIPVNFNQISFGKTLTKLPIDPINQTSTGNYYTYVPGGSWEITTLLESQKYSPQAINDGDAFPGVYSLKTSPNPLTPGLRDKGLVGYWSFDEGSGTIAYDRSGNNNNGTLINGPTWQDESNCKKGKCLSFDGVNDYVSYGSNKIPTGDAPKTISTWVKTSTSGPQVVVGFGNTVSNQEFSLGFEIGGDSRGIWLDYLGSGCMSGIFGTSGEWANIAVTYESSNVALYLNGKLIKTCVKYLSTGNSYRTIGTRIGNSWWLNGSVDEVRIYNRALSDAEIQAIYNATK